MEQINTTLSSLATESQSNIKGLTHVILPTDDELLGGVSLRNQLRLQHSQEYIDEQRTFTIHVETLQKLIATNKLYIEMQDNLWYCQKLNALIPAWSASINSSENNYEPTNIGSCKVEDAPSEDCFIGIKGRTSVPLILMEAELLLEERDPKIIPNALMPLGCYQPQKVNEFYPQQSNNFVYTPKAYWLNRAKLCTTGIKQDLLGNTVFVYYSSDDSSEDNIWWLPICHLSESITIGKPLPSADIILNWLDAEILPNDTASVQAMEFLQQRRKRLVNIDGELILIPESSVDNKNLTQEEIVETLKRRLLECDTERANLEPYDERQLTGLKDGHWDLWKNEQENGTAVNLNGQKFYARNPEMDILDNGMVGIDFGTKSTVAVRLEEDGTMMPLRIGIGNFKKKPEAQHYENPTFMELRDLESFRLCYSSSIGRPLTSWDDLVISHSAVDSFLGSSSDDYYAYFYALKQWASGNYKTIKYSDKQGNEYELPPYTEIMPDIDFDPIEIYAYLLGVNINNMRRKITMEYRLSFPATYDKAVRDHLLDSFSRGLKKSLPVSILENEELMKYFSVTYGASEPAAYAICALQEFGFEPSEGENFRFGVFDFGGGTTDFDFGIWRAAKNREARSYDYVIEHYGANGDPLLGGENILERLSFQVFKENADYLRENNFSFIQPEGCPAFPGSERLINDTQEARLNTKRLCEALRPLWERNDTSQTIFKDIRVKIHLNNNEGKQKNDQPLLIDENNLEQMIVSWIDNGVVQFFKMMQIIFEKEQFRSSGKMLIFLAGNSCKSPRVLSCFKAHIEQFNSNPQLKKNDFEIYPPLGTEEAKKRQEECNLNLHYENDSAPTGKTGVAFGLVRSREGARIKVINWNLQGDDINFKYYLGYSLKNNLQPVLTPESKMNEWIELAPADQRKLEFYYTVLPSAHDKNLPVHSSGVIMKRMVNPQLPSADKSFFVRCITPSQIEIAIASVDEDGKRIADLENINKITLD